MPTYEYRCQACGHTFEQFQSITADPIKVCPECHQAKVRRLIGTGAALIFKGSGFYQTDYRSPTYNSAAKAESPAKSDSSTKTESPSAAAPSSSDSNTAAGGTKPSGSAGNGQSADGSNGSSK
jgi:putative FmdB family regulatory protein